MKCFVAPRYFVGLDRVKETTTDQLIRDAVKDDQQGRKNTRAEFVNAQPNALSRHACERHQAHIKFFFDYDEVLPSGDPPPVQLIEQRKQRVLSEAHDILVTGAGCAPDSFTIHVAKRHGRLSDRQFKISFRLFVSGYRTTPYSIKNAIRTNQLCSFTSRSPKSAFDTSVYSKNRRLCMILGYKTTEDTRQLVPDTPSSSSSLQDYVVQHVQEDWPVVLVDANSAPHLTQAQKDQQQQHKRMRAAEDQDSSASRAAAPSSDPEEGADREAAEEEEIGAARLDWFEIIKDNLRDAGFVNARKVGHTREEKGGKEIHVPFDCEAREDCPVCHQQHDNQHWLALISSKQGVAVRSFSQRCFLVPLASTHFLHPFVSDLMVDASSHMHYASWFLKSREGTVRYHQGNGAFHEFKQQQWRPMPDELVFEQVRAFMTDQLLYTELARVQKWRVMLLRLGAPSGNADSLEKHIRKGINNAGNYPFLVSVAKIMKGMAFADSMLFDRKHDLLHFSNGVLELPTKTFRETVPEDFNTLTTGYDYTDSPSEEACQQHREFITKVYPDPAIREVAQRVMGCTLTGHNHSKKVFIFTDNGGDKGGNNGKTQVFLLHQQSMGDYAIVPKKDFLYDGPTSAEGASPFMAKLRGKRVAVPEELEPHKKLAEGIVKELTNGTNALIPVRDLYKSMTMMENCVKLMIGCNHGKFPRFDPYDEALTNRMLPVPHLSHFTSDRNRLDPVHHVYLADPSIAEKLRTDDIKMAHMLWCLEGYDAYVRLGGFGIDTLPTSVLDFKRTLIFKNTPVYAYLAEILEDTGDKVKDILHLAPVWDLYKKDRRSNKYLTLEQFEASFRVYVNSKVSNSFQYVKTASDQCRSGSSVARGFKIKAEAAPSAGGSNSMRDYTAAQDGSGLLSGVEMFL